MSEGVPGLFSPADRLVGARITGTDWHPAGLTIDDAEASE
jgi:hypothetical protein